MSLAPHVVAPRVDKHTHTFILLHGCDGLAPEFTEEFFESQASDDRTLPETFPTVKWVFPASQMRTSARFGGQLSQWFDIWSVDEPAEKEEIQLSGLRDSIREILDIIRNEASLVPRCRIILGGISQGCATAVHALLLGKIQLGGFVGFCSWLPLQEKVANIAGTLERTNKLRLVDSILNGPTQNVSASLQIVGENIGSAFDTPVFLSHSEDDEVVPMKNGMQLCSGLENLGFKVSWKCYEKGGHWIHEPQGVDDLINFLQVTVGLE
jgi:lysophospholipase-2